MYFAFIKNETKMPYKPLMIEHAHFIQESVDSISKMVRYT